MRGLSLLLLTAALSYCQEMKVPEENPLTQAKVDLGRRLFRDRRLSRDESIACATCHDPQLAFADDRVVARGIAGAPGTRNVPTLVNRGYGRLFFWDGRAPNLEQQVLQPILNPAEMGLTMPVLLERLRAGHEYRQQFRTAFARDVNPDDVARALASYVRTIRSGNSRFDRHLNGEKGMLTPQEQEGLNIFSGKANCWVCHSGSNFTDERFHNTGVTWHDGRTADDGRFAVTRDPDDRGAFKTPTLREVSRTAPYMHDGSLRTLEDVTEYYDRGGNPNPGLDPALHPLHLTAEEKSALTSFLRCLTGEISDRLAP